MVHPELACLDCSLSLVQTNQLALHNACTPQCAGFVSSCADRLTASYSLACPTNHIVSSSLAFAG